MPVTFRSTGIPNVTVREMQPFGDDRGFFVETYHHEKYAEAGIGQICVQDNYSHSKQGVLRGLHYQLPRPRRSWCPAFKDPFSMSPSIFGGAAYFWEMGGYRAFR
jgi:dTDP-4-dehydrorhamnose 3,5-epimerase-like enzyme